MHEAIEQRGDDHHIAEQARPVLERAVRGDDGGSFFVAAHEHVGELIARVRGELAQVASALAAWLLPVPGGPMKSTSSRWPMNLSVASSSPSRLGRRGL